MPAEAFGTTPLGHNAVARLEEWCQGLCAPLPWLEGPALEMDDFENPLTGAAAKFIRLAEMHNLTVVSYFCELPRHGPYQGGPEEKAAISLLYALLRQMIEAMPARLETTVDLSERRFTELDGTLETWSKATALLHDVLSTVSGVVFCIIDGLHWLDARITDIPLAELLQVLRKDNLRVLFTTSGRSGCLLEDMGRDEIHSLQHSSPHAARDINWGLSL